MTAVPFLRAGWRLILPYWRSEDRRVALGLLAAIVGLNLGAVYLLVLLNAWNRAFYDALQQHDYTAFTHQLGRFCLLAGVFIVAAVYRQYLTQTLEMRWRRWLTHEFLRNWLTDRVYYRFGHTRRAPTDNPDQRLAGDLRLLTSGTLALVVGLLNAVVTLVSFVGILWTLSGPLAVPLGRLEISIPAYLVCSAILYALAGSVITHRIGRPLVHLNATPQRSEADFRLGLIRLRERAEEVALYGGKPLEWNRREPKPRPDRCSWWRTTQGDGQPVSAVGFESVAVTLNSLLALFTTRPPAEPPYATQ